MFYYVCYFSVKVETEKKLVCDVINDEIWQFVSVLLSAFFCFLFGFFFQFEAKLMSADVHFAKKITSLCACVRVFVAGLRLDYFFNY